VCDNIVVIKNSIRVKFACYVSERHSFLRPCRRSHDTVLKCQKNQPKCMWFAKRLTLVGSIHRLVGYVAPFSWVGLALIVLPRDAMLARYIHVYNFISPLKNGSKKRNKKEKEKYIQYSQNKSTFSRYIMLSSYVSPSVCPSVCHKSPKSVFY